MITFSAVTKRFGDGTLALDEVTFHVEPGELVVITGPSGSGKTTLMKMLIREQMPTTGDVLYKGEALTDLPERKLPEHRRKIGVVFQDYKLLPELNVWENIALPLSIMGKSESEIESRVTDLVSLVGLADRALVFPKQLSGGEAQRVSLARALATGPSLIFADEPTGNLDTKTSLEIAKLLQQINSFGTTVLIATHDVTILDYLENERQVALEKGKLVHDSRPAAVPDRSAVKEIKLEESSENSEEKEEQPEEIAEEPIEKPAEKSAKKKPAKKSKSKKEKEPTGLELAEPEEPSLADEFHAVELDPPEEEKPKKEKKEKKSK